jgi:hypothetical protein
MTKKRTAEFVTKRAELEQAWEARVAQREELAEAIRDHDRKVGTPEHPAAIARRDAAQAAWDGGPEKDRHEAAHADWVSHLTKDRPDHQ